MTTRAPFEARAFWSGAALVLAVYFYFLIFAQFAFLDLVRQQTSAQGVLKLVMACMGAGGLLGSFAVPWLEPRFRVEVQMRAGLMGAAVIAVVALFARGAMLGLVAFGVGLFVGIVTVSLATLLRGLFNPRNYALGAAIGTGAAYFSCNVPVIFQGAAQFQTIAASLAAALGATLVPRCVVGQSEHFPGDTARKFSLAYSIILFGALVWLDSAAFYVIQNSELRNGTWKDIADLRRNASIHLLSAIVCGWMLPRAGFQRMLLAALAILGVASISANRVDTRGLTAWLYPAGVSIYSTCLVVYAAFGSSQANRRGVAKVAATLYAVSGWVCSAAGIGMAENLQRVPPIFVAVAGLVVVLPLIPKRRIRVPAGFRYLVVIFGVAVLLAFLSDGQAPAVESPVARGREVYIQEGCINCHSQYVRPGTVDEVNWGPATVLANSLAERPPLIGNRRQGPDLANVGRRRAEAWLAWHFEQPRDLAPGSSMPAYQHLVGTSRGADLIAYLVSLGGDSKPPASGDQLWMPVRASSGRGSELFKHHCVKCHGRDADRLVTGGRLRRKPAEVLRAELERVPSALPREARLLQLARVVKFGIPGTDMPGHEYLPDKDVFALAEYLEQQSARE